MFRELDISFKDYEKVMSNYRISFFNPDEKPLLMFMRLGNDINGAMNPWLKRIMINEKRCLSAQVKILIHELTHCVLIDKHLPFSRKEDLVENLTDTIFHAITQKQEAILINCLKMAKVRGR